MTEHPDRETVVDEVSYYAAVAFCFDTSDEADHKVVVTDVTETEPLPEGASHRFHVLVDKIECYVTSTPDGDRVEPDLNDPVTASEVRIRESVLETALEHWGYPGNYHSKEEMIASMLQDDPDETSHPVITEVEAPHGGLRQWVVDIGAGYCEVGMYSAQGLTGETDDVYFEVIVSHL